MKKVYQVLFSLAVFVVYLWVASLSAEADAHVKKVTKPVSTQKSTNIFNTDSSNYKPHEMLIKFKSKVSEKSRMDIIQSINGKELSYSKRGNYSLISVPGNKSIKGLAKKLNTSNIVELVEPNITYKKQYTPKDPHYKKQWYLPKIGMTKAWDKTKGASTIIVAVLDDGMQTNHPELTGKITKPKNIPKNSSAVTATDHGTHVAGIIAASMNKTGISGISPNVKLMPVQIFNGQQADAYSIGKGIIYAADQGAKVINMSFVSYYYSSYVHDAIDYAHSKGVVMIAAAGNDDTYQPTYPAALQHVLAVSATNQDDWSASFSNYGQYINYSAPGTNILSTIRGNKYEYMSGTSMSSPIVSGVAALLLSKNSWLTPAQVESILTNSAKDLGERGWDYFYGYGRIDANQALSKTPAPLSSISSAGTFKATGKNKLAISVNSYGNSKITVEVQNSKGKKVRTLLSNKAWNWGKVSTSWDGKTGTYTYAPSGTYKIVVKMTKGKKTITKSKTIKYTDKIAPDLKMTKTTFYFSPKISKSIKLPFELNTKSKMTAKLLNKDGKVLKTLWNQKTVNGGKGSITWDGKLNGKKVKDGIYKFRFEKVSITKVKGANQTVTVHVDSAVNGKLIGVPSIYKNTGENKQIAHLNSNESLYMTVNILDSKGKKLKTLAANKLYKANQAKLSWNGKDSKNKMLPEGKYFVSFELKDLAGNKKSLKSNAITLQDWLKPTVIGKGKLILSDPATGVTIPYTTSKAGKVTITIYQGNELIKTLLNDKQQAAGNNQLSWNGKINETTSLPNGSYTYKITVIDKYKQSGSNSAQLQVQWMESGNQK